MIALSEDTYILRHTKLRTGMDLAKVVNFNEMNTWSVPYLWDWDGILVISENILE